MTSNAIICRKVENILERLVSERWFDGIVVSSDEHIVKPDAGIYRILLERYGLNADECLFIDDRADNVRGAVESGMNAYVFNNDFETVKSRYGL